MTRVLRRIREARQRPDDGIAIVAAIAVVALVGVLVVVTVGIALTEARQTGRDRQRSEAVAAAEAQVTTLTAQIQAAAPTALASLCGTIPTTSTVGRDTYTSSTTVTYYNAAGTAVPCTALATTTVSQAAIKTTSTSSRISGTQAARRTVESLVRLTPHYANNLDKAIFSDATMTVSNKTVLASKSGTPDADIYTNGDFYCRNNQEYHGSIYAQGLIKLEAQCTVSVDAWAKGNVEATNQSASIGGRALSSNGNVSLNKTPVGQQARARYTASGDVCATAGKCFSNVVVDAPPTTSFPQLTWDSGAAAGWASHGYTNVVTFPQGNFQCGWYNPPGNQDLVGADGQTRNLNGKADGVGAWLYANAFKLPGPTIVVNTCANDRVTLQGIDIVPNNDIVLISRAGFTFSSNTTITAKAGTATAEDPALLYLIQPSVFQGATIGCSGDGIALDNQVTVDKTVNTLLYSPCSIRKANKSEIVGQVYSGKSVTVDNQLDMTYIPMPVWGGLSGSSTVSSYGVEVQYTRETTP
ncbi:hypothetical protein [Cellulomonas olei]|uniref:hypothetical protein n=1 Tax=Cellulomonas sp. P4 TaxID=3142533 RepID=UPI0031BB36E5